MRRRGARSATGPILIGLLAAALAGCGEEEKSSFKDAKIVEALKLEKDPDSGGYRLDGDPFCVLSNRFFNDPTEVEAALGEEDTGTVVASRAGNVAVEGIPSLFGPACEQRARKRLDKLDLAPNDE